MKKIKVTLRVRVWIETGIVTVSILLTLVTLRVRVWIETLKTHKYINIIQSPSA